MLDIISQIGITVFGVIAAWITQQRNESLKKYACILGLMSQPFWFYTAVIAEQWGVFANSVMFTVIWIIGIKTYWITGSKAAEGASQVAAQQPDVSK